MQPQAMSQIQMVQHPMTSFSMTPQQQPQLTVSEEYYYTLLAPHAADFDLPRSALSWLSRAVPSRSFKLAVPQKYRIPKSIAGQGGYSITFVDLGLTLREADTSTGTQL
jgi:hypothetical protein